MPSFRVCVCRVLGKRKRCEKEKRVWEGEKDTGRLKYCKLHVENENMSPRVKEGDPITKLKCSIRFKHKLPEGSTPRFEVTCAQSNQEKRALLLNVELFPCHILANEDPRSGMT